MVFCLIVDDEFDDYTPKQDEERRKSRDVTPSEEGSEISSEMSEVNQGQAIKPAKFE